MAWKCIKYMGIAVFALAVTAAFKSANAGGYVEVDPGVKLYYEEAGAGKTVVMVPGWTMTVRFFDRQLAHHSGSEKSRFIVYDPRAHGRSSKTLEGTNYLQHAQDLERFIDSLGLEDVVLAGWSWGGVTVYNYLALFGSENLKGVVLIDQTPKPLPAGEGSWTDGGADVAKGFFNAMVADRTATAADFIPWMFTNPISDDEASWMLAETMMTPDIVATQLLYDGWMADHVETVKSLALPQLYFVREENEAAARTFLSENSPNAEIVALGGHGMFYDHADAFNAALDAFLDKME